MGRDWSEEPIRVKKKMAGLGDLLDVGMDTEEKRKYHVCEPIYLSIYLSIYLFIYGCVGSSFPCEGFLSLRQAGATLHRGARASHYRGLSLWSTASRRTGSVVAAHGPSCSAACGIFLDQGSNPCPLHWQADSHPLRHKGSPRRIFKLRYHLGMCRSLDMELLNVQDYECGFWNHLGD